MSVESFELAFGRGFLVLSGLRLKRSGGSAITLEELDTTQPISSPTGGYSVFPILKRPGAPFDFVSVGRAPGNDIVLGDQSVSMFHAFFRETAEGFVLQDGNSKNGTCKNGREVPRRGAEQVALLAPGDRVEFGSVPLTFFRADGLLELIGGLAHTKW